MLPALIVPSVRPTGSIANGLTLGATTQFSFRQYLIGGGFTDYTTGPVWSSGTPSIATVDNTGLVTGQSAGSAVITATLAGASANFTVRVTTGQAQDGSLADLRATIGDGNIVSVWNYSQNVTLDGGGKLSQCDDQRGAQYGPSIFGFGTTKPTLSGGVVTTDGVQNYMATAASTIWGLARDRTHVIAHIGSMPPGGVQFPIMMSANGGGPYMGLTVQSGNLVDAVFTPGNSPSAQEGTSVNALYNEPSTSSHRLWIVEHHAREGGAGTLNQQALAYRFPNRTRHLRGDGTNSNADPDGTSFLSAGLLPPTNFYPLAQRGMVVLSCVPTAAMYAALDRYATAVVGSSALVTSPKPSIKTFGDSITQGAGASDQAHSFPAQLQALPSMSGYEVSNRGVSSRTLLETARASLSGAGLWQRQILADILPGDWVTMMIGTNDMGQSSPTILLPLYTILADAVMGAGGKLLVITVPKRSSVTGQAETDRQTLNTALKLFPAQGHATTYYDLAAEPLLQNPADTTYFADGTHFTNAGYAIYAAGVAAAIIAKGG